MTDPIATDTSTDTIPDPPPRGFTIDVEFLGGLTFTQRAVFADAAAPTSVGVPFALDGTWATASAARRSLGLTQSGPFWHDLCLMGQAVTAE